MKICSRNWSRCIWVINAIKIDVHYIRKIQRTLGYKTTTDQSYSNFADHLPNENHSHLKLKNDLEILDICKKTIHDNIRKFINILIK